MFFRPKIEVFVRHCHYSAVSAHKGRFPQFSRQRCFDNFLATLPSKGVNVTFFLDTFYPTKEPHFIHGQKRFKVIEIKEGTEAGSFLALLDYVSSQKYSPQTILYFLEDDYLHRPRWAEVLLEGFTLPEAEYITLYDHRDKYGTPLQAKLFYTPTCHWRTTPSTTNTYAMRFATLLKHLETHRSFSLGRKISADHDKFCKLNALGAVLLSSIPGWSTHAEPEFASPCIDWQNFLNGGHVYD